MKSDPPTCISCGSELQSSLAAGQCMACLLQLAKDGQDSMPGGHDPFVSLLEQTRFADYEIESEIARGGMGVVFRARQISLNRPVALKMIIAGQLASPDLVRRFQTEAEAAAKLAHPHIVPIYEVGESETLHFFSMKLIEGENLASLINEYRVQDGTASQVLDRQRRIAKMMLKIANALALAHKHGVLHRDIKPSNILVDVAGEPYLTDFGLAKLTEQTQDTLTRTTAVLGSPSYMSPEQASGDHDQMTTLADIYSFGAVLYELLTGQPPFAGKNAIETIRRVIDQTPERLRSVNERIHPDLETIALRCLQKEPHLRYASAAEVGAELDRFLRGESIEARPVGPFQELWRWAKRNRRVSLLAVTLFLALVCGTVGVAWQSRRATKANETLTEMVATLTWSRITDLVTRGEVRLALTHLARMMRDDPTDWRVAMYAMSVLDQSRCHVPVGPEILHPGQAIITAVQLDPTGRILATGSEDKTIRLWSVSDSQQIGRPLVFDGVVKSLAFDHSGERLAAVSGKGKLLQVFDVESRQEIRSLRFDNQIVQLEYPSPQPQVVVVEGSSLHVIDLDREDFDQVYDFQQSIAALSLSSDAKRAVLRLNNGEAIAVDVESGTELLRVNEFRIGDATISANGRLVAACENNFGNAAVWDIESGLRKCKLDTHEGEVTNLTFAADGNRLFASSVLQEWVVSYDTHTGLQSGSRMTHAERVTSIHAFDGQRQLMMVSGRNGVRFWDALTGDPSASPVIISKGIVSAGSTESGDLLWTGSCSELGSWHIDSIQLWRLHEPQVPPVLAESPEPYLASAGTVSPDGHWVAANVVQRGSNGYDRVEYVTIVDVTTGETLRDPLPLDSTPYGLAFTPDGSRLLIVTVRGKIYLLSTPDFELIKGPIDSGNPIQPSRMSPTGDRFATGSANGWVAVWDLESLTPIWKERHSDSRLNDLCFSESGRWLGSCSNDGTAKVWDVDSGQVAVTLLGHTDKVYHIKIDEQKQLLATNSDDRRTILWELATGRRITSLEHAVETNSISIHPTKELIVTADRDGRCRLWNTQNGQPVGRPMVHDQPVVALSFSEDGERILAADQSGFRLWDTETQQPLTVLHPHPTQASLGVDSDGCRPVFFDHGNAVFCGTVSYRCQIWRLPPPRGDVPSWCPEFIESIVMQRFPSGSDIPVLVESKQHEQLKTQLSQHPDSDYLRWSRRWLESVNQAD
ncbi:Serine/threonine-protein kinase PknB [Stieleria neptunia]|uniref:non-specific serine/threonine protein kinase n=1 Tax=Stieleria neptunia TaxID=2527979 RepID=A0A518HPP6_9BACT|nr:protein kinase [Stieleria neptunia]QDV42815.1 Serine/threonine-protein kinase PknB [Stieleria neptunia]